MWNGLYWWHVNLNEYEYKILYMPSGAIKHSNFRIWNLRIFSLIPLIYGSSTSIFKTAVFFIKSGKSAIAFYSFWSNSRFYTSILEVLIPKSSNTHADRNVYHECVGHQVPVNKRKS
jgi:hypothetical protein